MALIQQSVVQLFCPCRADELAAVAQSAAKSWPSIVCTATTTLLSSISVTVATKELWD
jgi:hypothetical protein